MSYYSLLCTTRFDPCLEAFEWNNAPDGTPSPYLLLSYQLDRLISSARLNSWSVSELNYTTLKAVCDKAVRNVNGSDRTTPLKIRVLFPHSGDITASASQAEPLRHDPTAGSRFNPYVDDPTHYPPILSLYIDTRPTSGTTSMKTTNRQPYDDARARVGIPPPGTPRPSDIVRNHPDDVVLFNTSGDIMESSICNIAFYRNGCWLTPPLTVGCISGVFRRWLLENGRIYEADEHTLSLNTVENGEWVLIFNGVAGCRLGRLCYDRNPGAEH